MLDGERIIAEPINDEQALRLAQNWVADRRSDLTPEQQYSLASELSYYFKLIENHQASNAALGRAVNGAIQGDDG